MYLKMKLYIVAYYIDHSDTGHTYFHTTTKPYILSMCPRHTAKPCVLSTFPHHITRSLMFPTLSQHKTRLHMF